MTHVVPSQSSSLDDWLCYLESIHPSNIDMGLTRVRLVGEKLGYTTLPNVILIAGTNGKGTTARCLEALLLSQGYSVGTYASPHLIRYNERVRINGSELSDQDHVAAFHALEQGRGDISLTYFEFGTLAALEVFKQKQPDYILLEVGLGGRLDATNIVEPIASVITTIDLDHKEYLGDTRELVGREKAGIFRANAPAIVGDLAIPSSIWQYAKELGTQVTAAQQNYSFALTADLLTYQNGDLTLSLPVPNIPAQNVATAITTLYTLGLLPNENTICDVLTNLTVEGRFQCLSEQPLVYADVAHNPESARYLASKLATFQAQGKTIIALAGMLQDKDQKAVFNAVKSNIDQWHLANLTCFRGDKADNLLQQLHSEVDTANATIHDSVASGLQTVLANMTEDQLLIVFGSFYTVADAIAFWQNKE
ncbi:Bifunctional protein FolC [Pseudoalteromonas sp. P1-9]|uniref:bifunctional tetrahydrofolate synthase/dihydrofolate synthase n=1 Tax=Pseudoalteromonas sp. P1-9 TaxID=1710354 RepID=UPI0006D60E70|nr:bifunctional tetrahydrofolate synthase/dihydrofolate synthase [Pseudoalteromonas sp. P1-9]KPV95628.1 Bifunctional protein FolC [Pseudoalteromonas sp. P1-9]